MTKTHHLALIGVRYPQLALGTLMAKRGFRVLIVDQNSAQSTLTGEEGNQYAFRRRPAPLFGLDSNGLLRRFLDEIGIGRMLVRRSYPSNSVSYQVVLPRHRINLYPQRDATMEELSREFPESVDSFKALYSELDGQAGRWYEGYGDLPSLERGWGSLSRLRNRGRAVWQSREVASLLQGFDGMEQETAFLSLQHHFLGGYPFQTRPSALSAALIHSIGRRGTFREPVGTTSITSLMSDRFQEYGGEILRGAKAANVRSGPGNFVTIDMEGGPDIQTVCLATTSGIAGAVDGLSHGAGKNQDDENGLRVPVRFFLGIDASIVPVGMEDNLFYMRDDDGGPLGLKALYLSMGPSEGGSSEGKSSEIPSGSEGSDGDGNRSLTATALVDRKVLRGMTEEIISAAERDILQALEAVIPFLDRGLNFLGSDLTAKAMEAAPRPLGGWITSWIPALVGRSRVLTGRRGRVAVMEVPPWELGLEGETLTALAAAGALRKVLEKAR
ncbi:MAG TPA: hypothetical protein ENH32_01470 [Proteobacteria bacterium]|nr:hypothetical protein BMS3Abin14_01534 [bacterium BMS3Abin14]HDL52624.1 hypothetical protein [Pseudomonadota bacterium]